MFWSESKDDCKSDGTAIRAGASQGPFPLLWSVPWIRVMKQSLPWFPMMVNSSEAFVLHSLFDTMTVIQHCNGVQASKNIFQGVKKNDEKCLASDLEDSSSSSALVFVFEKRRLLHCVTVIRLSAQHILLLLGDFLDLVRVPVVFPIHLARLLSVYRGAIGK